MFQHAVVKTVCVPLQVGDDLFFCVVIRPLVKMPDDRG